MAFSITYKRLFEVECWHGYYLNTPDQEFGALGIADRRRVLKAKAYDLRSDIEIVPTEETLRRLAGERLVFKTLPAGFFVAIRAEENGAGAYVPESLPAENLRLTFYLRVRNSLFFNYTSLALHDNDRKVYHFSNLSGASSAVPEPDTLYLSRAALPYSERAYRAGELAAAGGKLFESLADQATPVAPPATDAWHALAAAGYVHTGDRITRFGPVEEYRFQTPSVKSARFSLLDSEGQERPVRLIPQAGAMYPQTETDARGNSYPIGTIEAAGDAGLSFAKLDLRSLPAGAYGLKVVGELASGDAFEENLPACLIHDAQPVWAVLEIWYKGGDALGPYQMIDAAAGNALLLPRYVLHFRNRSTYWRYRFGTVPAKKPKKSELLEEDGAYVTPRPQPLTTSYTPITYNSSPLPNPSVGRIKPEQSKIYSDIYL